MKVIHVPCLEDNYSYIIIDETTKEAAVVDPVEPEKVLRVCDENCVHLKFVLTTHHHWTPVQAPAPEITSSGSNVATANAPSDTYGQAASILVAGSNLEQTIQQIMDIGGGNWDKEIVTRALRAAYNNPERAVDYLDHAGGNEKIKELVPGIKVYGGSLDNVKGSTNKLENGDKLSLGTDIQILALHTPSFFHGEVSLNNRTNHITDHWKMIRPQKNDGVLCGLPLKSHTKGHISYYLTGKDEENPAVFTGDTLFVAGCGKFFEGTAEQMYQSLCVTLGSLPNPTRVYCGHEYTVKNLQFALTVEPENAKIAQKLSWAQHQRQAGLPTVPSTIEEELETNPFMRVDLPEIQAKVGCKSPIEAMREIRQRKDNWRG
ncbi:unnamed protein product [Camellia sinensis]